MNVLITAASRRVALVTRFHAALRGRLGGKVIVTDIDPSSPAVHVADRAYRVPSSTAPGYVEALLDICQSEHIGLMVPTIDDELEVIAAANARFALLGVRVACSPPATAALCNDKLATCRHLSASGIAAAESWLPESLPADVELPLFIKPRIGRGSVGAYPIRSRRELDFFVDYVSSPVIQRFLSGAEYTIDVLCDWNGRPVAIVPRERTVIRAGVSDRGCTVRSRDLTELAEQVVAAIPFRGPLNIQCRLHEGRPVVFEINPRFSGGISLTMAAGADFPSLLLALTRGDTLPSDAGDYRADLWMTNYETAIFLPSSHLALQTLDRTRPSLSGAA